MYLTLSNNYAGNVRKFYNMTPHPGGKKYNARWGFVTPDGVETTLGIKTLDISEWHKNIADKKQKGYVISQEQTHKLA